MRSAFRSPSPTPTRTLFVVSKGAGALFMGAGIYHALFESFPIGAALAVTGWFLMRLARLGLEMLNEKEESWRSR